MEWDWCMFLPGHTPWCFISDTAAIIIENIIFNRTYIEHLGDYQQSSYDLLDGGSDKTQQKTIKFSGSSCVTICISVFTLLAAGGAFAFVIIKMNNIERKMQLLEKSTGGELSIKSI